MEQTQQGTSAQQECPDCHALAADLEAHKRWHSRLVHDIAIAVDTAAVNQCTSSAVRAGQTLTRTDSGVPGANDDLVTTVTNKTVYVDVTC